MPKAHRPRGYTYDSALRIVTLDIAEDAGAAAIIEHFERVIVDSSIPLDAGCLVDLRHGARIFLFNEVHEFTRWFDGRSRLLQGRRAFITQRPGEMGAANIFCAFLRPRGIEAEVFTDEESAIAWLCSSECRVRAI